MVARTLVGAGVTAEAAAVIAQVVDLLRDQIGLNPDSVGRGTIERAISRHRSTEPSVAAATDWTAYLAQVTSDPRVFESLVEQVVVPETWFFRDRYPFEWLQTYAMEHWLPEVATQGGSRRSLRVLSAPCASGEEPYSIAMTLLLAGFPEALLTVDAIDICHHALDRARQGLYSKHSFRGMGGQPLLTDGSPTEPTGRLENPAPTDRAGSLRELVQACRQYFHLTDRGWQLDRRVAKLVNFQHANLLTWPGSGQLYDVIFCRNLLIYLEPEARQQALDLLSRLLRPGGVLLVGAAEAAHVPLDRFESLRQPFTFAYRYCPSAEPMAGAIVIPALSAIESGQRSGLARSTSSSATLSRPSRPSSAPPTIPPATQPAVTTGRSPSRFAPVQPAAQSAIAGLRPVAARRSPNQDWLAIQALADRGAIAEAIDRCQSYLASHQTDAAARLLLGQLYGAAGDSQKSEQQFRQALYLNPQCPIALTHLALLLEARGNRAQAALIRQRLARLPVTSGRSAAGHSP
jgi:chemotaxis protein methyltransferase WspC